MNYIQITDFDSSNGYGIRVVLWVSGCSHECAGCHNPHTWSKGEGKQFTENTLKDIIELLKRTYIRGLTLSGGDPLYVSNRDEILNIVTSVKRELPNKDIWLYTGYTWEEVKDSEIVKYVDVMVDGEFLIDKKDLRLKFRGSSNQRLINVKKSLEENRVVLLEEN